jgi:FAD/FMN-containing dehydrogenase
LGGPIFHPLSRQAIRYFDSLARSAPDELTVLGGSLMGPDGNPAFATLVCYCGDEAEGEKLLRPLRSYAKPVLDLIQMRPYLEMQSLFDPSYPAGDRYYNKSYNVRVVSDELAEVVLEYSAKRPTPRCTIAFQQLHGVAARVEVGATAFPHRYDHYVVWIEAISGDPADDRPMIQWAQDCWRALEPFADASIYVNAVCEDNEGGSRKPRDAYGANYERLRDLKRRFDPNNVFRQNTNIEPG